MQEQLDLSLEMVNFLESVSSLYPDGIALKLFKEELLEEDEPIATSTPSISCSIPCFIGIKKDPQGHALLESAISKGMKLNIKDVKIIYIRELKTTLSEALGDAELIVFMGKEASLAAGCDLLKSIWGEAYDRDALLTLDPAKVAKDSALKRDFWNDLQLVMGEMS